MNFEKKKSWGLEYYAERFSKWLSLLMTLLMSGLLIVIALGNGQLQVLFWVKTGIDLPIFSFINIKDVMSSGLVFAIAISGIFTSIKLYKFLIKNVGNANRTVNYIKTLVFGIIGLSLYVIANKFTGLNETKFYLFTIILPIISIAGILVGNTLLPTISMLFKILEKVMVMAIKRYVLTMVLLFMMFYSEFFEFNSFVILVAYLGYVSVFLIYWRFADDQFLVALSVSFKGKKGQVSHVYEASASKPSVHVFNDDDKYFNQDIDFEFGPNKTW